MGQNQGHQQLVHQAGQQPRAVHHRTHRERESAAVSPEGDRVQSDREDDAALSPPGDARLVADRRREVSSNFRTNRAERET